MHIKHTHDARYICHHYLSHLGYTEEELREKKLTIALISLHSEETHKALYNFTTSQNTSDKLLKVLTKGGLSHLVFVVSTWLECVNPVWEAPTQDEMQKAFDKAMESYDKEKDTAEINLYYNS